MSFPHRTSVRSSMQIKYCKEGIALWHAGVGGGGEAVIDFSLCQVNSPQKQRSKQAQGLSVVELLCGSLSPFRVHSGGGPDAAV